MARGSGRCGGDPGTGEEEAGVTDGSSAWQKMGPLSSYKSPFSFVGHGVSQVWRQAVHQQPGPWAGWVPGSGACEQCLPSFPCCPHMMLLGQPECLSDSAAYCEDILGETLAWCDGHFHFSSEHAVAFEA